MITAVDGNGGYSGGKQFVTAEELWEKLSHLLDKKALIVELVLAMNAAKDATELFAKLWPYLHTAQTKANKQHLSRMGLDLSKGTTRNNLEAEVIEPAMSKVKIIQFATEAAITFSGLTT